MFFFSVLDCLLRYIWHGIEGPYFVLVTELLNYSLDDYLLYQSHPPIPPPLTSSHLVRRRKTQPEKYLNFALQLFQGIKFFHNHSCRLIYRNLSLENIFLKPMKKKKEKKKQQNSSKSTHPTIPLTSSKKTSPEANDDDDDDDDESFILCFTDFYYMKSYWNFHENHHNLYREGRKRTTCLRFASLNQHLGKEFSRRDDLESLGYLFVYLMKGSLPWQGIPSSGDREEKNMKVYEKKSSTSLISLCEGCPEQFINYLEYVRGLSFDETPNYLYLEELLVNAMNSTSSSLLS